MAVVASAMETILLDRPAALRLFPGWDRLPLQWDGLGAHPEGSEVDLLQEGGSASWPGASLPPGWLCRSEASRLWSLLYVSRPARKTLQKNHVFKRGKRRKNGF